MWCNDPSLTGLVVCAQDKADRMKAFQLRLRVGKSASAEAAAVAAAKTENGKEKGEEVVPMPGSLSFLGQSDH